MDIENVQARKVGTCMNFFKCEADNDIVYNEKNRFFFTIEEYELYFALQQTGAISTI